MKTKKLLLIPLIPLLCSFTPRVGAYNTVGITLFSYTEYTSSGSTSYGIGHSFVMLENNRSWSLDLGFDTLGPFSKVTIGLWGNDGSSSSSSDEGWNVLTDGIFYNREAYVFTTKYDNPSDMIKLYREVNCNDFITRISNFSGNKNYLEANAEQYSLLGYNCSNFAAEFFAITTLCDFGPVASPATLNAAMNNRYDPEPATKNEIFETYSYWRYKNDGTCQTFPN